MFDYFIRISLFFAKLSEFWWLSTLYVAPSPLTNYTAKVLKFENNICDWILENGSKSHMKSIVFQHVFNCISTYAYVFPEYLLHNFDNLSIKFHVIIWNNVENVISFMLQ